MKTANLPVMEAPTDVAPTPAPSATPLIYERLLVPTDFSAPSLKALDYALALAAPFGNVRLHHVMEPRLDYLSLESLYTLEPDEEIVASCRLELEQAATERRASYPKLTCQVAFGQPAHEIVAAARDFQAELLVLSTHGRTGLKHLLMGSVAERVVRHAPCPVLALRNHEHEFVLASQGATPQLNLKKILVPTDFSPRSLASLRYAARFAKTFGGKITLFHSLNPLAGFVPSEYPIVDDSIYRETEASVRRQAELRLQENVPAELIDEAVVRSGPALAEILAFTEKNPFDLIICATHSAAPLQHALLGSTAERIIRHAPGPVLVVGDEYTT